MDVEKLVKYDQQCPTVCEDDCSTCLIHKLNELEVNKVGEKVVDLQKRREGKRNVYITGMKNIKTFHNLSVCPRLGGAVNVFIVSLAELKELHPKVKECKSCGPL